MAGIEKGDKTMTNETTTFFTIYRHDLTRACQDRLRERLMHFLNTEDMERIDDYLNEYYAGWEIELVDDSIETGLTEDLY